MTDLDIHVAGDDIVVTDPASNFVAIHPTLLKGNLPDPLALT